MAKLDIIEDPEEGVIDFTLSGAGPHHQDSFTFKLKKTTLTPDRADWRALLDETEKLQVFNAVLHKFRLRSLVHGGMKLAALGITEAGDIYLGANTERLSSSYFRQCAEQNMVTALTQADVYEQICKNSREHKPIDAFTPHEPKLAALYLLGGKDSDTAPTQPLCPCGNCTDMLAKVMAGKDAPMYMLPMRSRQEMPPVNSAASNIGEVQAGSIWKTDMRTLNAHRSNRTPGKAVVEAQSAGLARLLQKGPRATEQEAEKLQKAFSAALPQHPGNLPELAQMLLNPALALAAIGKLPADLMDEGRRALDVMLKQAENTLANRQSVPQLDATMKGGKIDICEMNHFMVHEIQRGFSNRLQLLDIAAASPAKVRALVEANMQTIRCVVLQLDDGTFSYAVETRTEMDKAAPSAEMGALTAAMARLGTHGVREVWAMEMSPRDIAPAKGDPKMHTATKEGAERIIKRGTHDAQGNVRDVPFHFIAFNNGDIKEEAKLKGITQDLRAHELFPSLYLGYGLGRARA